MPPTARAEDLEALEYRIDNFIVMELRGRVDEINTGVLRDEIHTIINTGRCRLAIDLRNTDFLSAHCLAAIWKCQKRARNFGGDIALFGARGQVAETIDFVKLSLVLPCFPSKEDVVEYFGSLDAKRDSKASQQQIQDGILPKFMRFFQFAILCAFIGYSPLIEVSKADGAENANSGTARQATQKPLKLEDLQQLAMIQGAQAKFQSLKRQERVQDLEMTHSLQLPAIALTTGYLYQSNPNLITELANRELNQLRQRGAESEFSDFQSNSNLKIDQDLVVVSMGLIQAIYTGGLYKARQELAQNQIVEQEAQGLLETMGTKENIENLYWGILLTEKKIDLLKTKQKGAQNKLQAIEAKFREETVGRSALAEAKLEELGAMQQLLAAEQDLEKLKNSLNTLIGRNPEDELVLVEGDFQAVEEPSNLEQYVALAENRHPELRFAAARIDTARAYQKTVSAGAVRSPKAFFFGGVDHTRGVADRTDLVNWTLGVAMSVPIYDGGRSFAETEKSRLLLEQARLGLDQARRKIELEVREAIGELRKAKINLEIAEQAQEIATDQASMARSAILDGQAPQFEIERSHVAEIEAQLALLAAKAEMVKWSTKLKSLTVEERL